MRAPVLLPRARIDAEGAVRLLEPGEPLAEGGAERHAQHRLGDEEVGVPDRDHLIGTAADGAITSGPTISPPTSVEESGYTNSTPEGFDE
jgi:hypothetical protein